MFLVSRENDRAPPRLALRQTEIVLARPVPDRKAVAAAATLSGNSREWVRFSEEWDKIAQMCERLLATMSTGDQRPTGPKSKALAAE
jgi:hypothetical protein